MSQPIVYFVRHDHPALHVQRASFRVAFRVIQVIELVDVKPSLLQTTMSERQPLLHGQSSEQSAKPRPTPVPWRQLIVVCLIRVRLAFMPFFL